MTQLLRSEGCTCHDRSWFGPYHDTQCPRWEGRPAGEVAMTQQTINCDQVSWLYDALDRYHKAMRLCEPWPAANRYRLVNRLCCLQEIMRILGLRFEDEPAQSNALVHVKGLSGTSPDSKEQPTRD